MPERCFTLRCASESAYNCNVTDCKYRLYSAKDDCDENCEECDCEDCDLRIEEDVYDDEDDTDDDYEYQANY